MSSLFIYPGAFATADSAQLTAWCNAALGRPAVGSPSDLAVDPNHLAPPHRKSEPRPPYDCDVHLIDGDNSEPEARRLEGPMRVVADSFQELVVQSNTSVLLELANDCTRANDVRTHFIKDTRLSTPTPHFNPICRERTVQAAGAAHRRTSSRSVGGRLVLGRGGAHECGSQLDQPGVLPCVGKKPAKH